MSMLLLVSLNISADLLPARPLFSSSDNVCLRVYLSCPVCKPCFQLTRSLLACASSLNARRKCMVEEKAFWHCCVTYCGFQHSPLTALIMQDNTLIKFLPSSTGEKSSNLNAETTVFFCLGQRNNKLKIYCQAFMTNSALYDNGMRIYFYRFLRWPLQGEKLQLRGESVHFCIQILRVWDIKFSKFQTYLTKD